MNGAGYTSIYKVAIDVPASKDILILYVPAEVGYFIPFYVRAVALFIVSTTIIYSYPEFKVSSGTNTN